MKKSIVLSFVLVAYSLFAIFDLMFFSALNSDMHREVITILCILQIHFRLNEIGDKLNEV